MKIVLGCNVGQIGCRGSSKSDSSHLENTVSLENQDEENMSDDSSDRII